MNGPTLVFRNVSRQTRRTVLTILTFALATFIFTVLIAIPSSIDLVLQRTSETLRLYSYNADGRYIGLPSRYCRDIEKLPGVAACTPMVIMRATYQSPTDVIQAFAVDADRAPIIYADYGIAPKVLESFVNERTSAIAGALLIRNHHWKIGDVITLRGDSGRLDIRFVLVGETPSNNYPNFFMFHRDYLVEAEKKIGIPEVKHPAGLLVTRVKSAADVPRVIKEVDETFHNSDYETVTMTESDAVAGLLSTVGDVRGLVYSVFLVILLTVLLIAANAMSMMVRDRLRDVAVLRALGFGPSYVISLLLGECILIGGAGGVVGGGLALWLFNGGTTISSIIGGAGYLTITSTAAITALAAALIVSVLSGLVPIIGAMRVTPADAFRRAV
jgi:putative ABC transport system permease protein